ncbi:MAG TPA: hypothetical protein VM662_13035 [Sphingomonas sp.]|nr:hypothetical protein [Sphingomonas sp.]
MASYVRQKPAGWFVVVALILVLWGIAGCASLYAHLAYGPALDPGATEWDRAYYDALPGWFAFVYAVAVLGGLLGSLALLMRSKLARPLFVLSLIAVVVQFGYVFLGTDLIGHKGAGATLPFPLFIAAMAVFQIWLAGYAERRGWIS